MERSNRESYQQHRDSFAKKCGEIALLGTAAIVILPSGAAYLAAEKLGRLLGENPIAIKVRAKVSQVFDVALGKTLEVLPPKLHALNSSPDFFCDGEPQPFTQHKPRLGIQRRDRAVGHYFKSIKNGESRLQA